MSGNPEHDYDRFLIDEAFRRQTYRFLGGSCFSSSGDDGLAKAPHAQVLAFRGSASSRYS